MRNGVRIVARLTPPARLTFRVHESVWAPKPKVMDRHRQRKFPPLRGEMHGRAQGRVRIMKVDDIRHELSASRARLRTLWPAEKIIRAAVLDRWSEFRVSRHQDFDIMMRAQQCKLLRNISYPLLRPPDRSYAPRECAPEVLSWTVASCSGGAIEPVPHAWPCRARPGSPMGWRIRGIRASYR